MKSDISVVIPLYNKEKEIARTLRSVLAQTSQPLEIIVVDDGSTDGSAARVEEIGSPLIRLIRQENRGVSAARNRAMQEACGEYAALLDGDDTWEPGYLAEIERLIAAYPNCGAYATSFNVDDGHRLTPGDTPQTEGVVDFFTEALSHYVLIPSSTTLRRKPVLCAAVPEHGRTRHGSVLSSAGETWGFPGWISGISCGDADTSDRRRFRGGTKVVRRVQECVGISAPKRTAADL